MVPMARGVAVAFALVAAVALFAVAQGCSSNGDTSGPADCAAAGGQCVLGGDPCDERGPQDCNPTRNPGGAFCCLAPASESDAGEDASGSAVCVAAGGQCVRPGSGPCTLVGPEEACSPDQVGGTFCCAVPPHGGTCSYVQASSYDQACVVDTDCVAISSNTACLLCGLKCPNATVNARAQSQYLSDIANTTASHSSQRMACTGDCGFNFGPCCIDGRCQMGSQCAPPVSSVTCTLGAACSSTDLCTGGIVHCESNCQCLNGTWQAPCPTNLPQTGSACTPAGAECGYTTSTNACGADNCYCQSGVWTCGPSCIIGDASASADTGADSATDSGPLDAGGE
jgi:hypothetical protein